MPCSCIVPGPKYPENQEWGPFVWRMLHSLAERVTKVVTPLYQKDERHAWVNILNTTGTMLPCSDCRDHYKQYLERFPVKDIMTLPYASLGEWIRRWIFNIHNSVNVRLDKPIFSYNDLATTYSNFDPMNYKLFDLVEKRAIQQGGINILAWNTWTKHYRTLTSVYGI